MKIICIFVHELNTNVMYNNRQSAAGELSNNQIQVLLTGKFGDGGLYNNARAKYNPTWDTNYHYVSNSVNLEYINFKKSLLGDLCKRPIHSSINRGFKSNPIYTISTKIDFRITSIANESLKESLTKMDGLGLALWIYDDGSLHRTKEFYNLNTQAYSREVNEDILVPFLFNKFNIKAKVTPEHKPDGREYWYLRIGRFDGAFEISKILYKYPIESLNYKLISSETIQKWSRLQEQPKSTDIDIASLGSRKLSFLLKKIFI